MNTQKKSAPSPNGGANVKRQKRRRNRKNRRKSDSPGNSGFSVSTRSLPLAMSAIVSNDRNDSRVLTKASDYVTNITGTTSFALKKTISVNPGLAGSFPMLYQIAKAYQYYRFTKFTIRYVPSCASTHAGSIMIVPEFNVNDPAPESWAAAANDGLSIQGQSFTGLSRSIPVSRMFNQGKHKMIRCGNVPDSKNLYDACTIFVMTQNQSDTSEIGSLYFDYEVEFVTRQTSLGYDPAPSRANYYTYQGATINLVDGSAKAYPFNTLESGWNPLSIPSPVSGKFILPCGSYILTASVGYSDTQSEFFRCATYIVKNGSIVGSTTVISTGRDLTISYANGNVSALVASNGSDEFEVMGEVSNRTGTGVSYYTQDLGFLLITVA